MWLTLHLLAYLSLAAWCSRFVPRAVAWKRARSYDGCMSRIAKLEIELGLGLDIAREWFERQKPRGEDLRYKNICKPICYGCDRTYEGSYGPGGQKLCPECARRANVRAAA